MKDKGPAILAEIVDWVKLAAIVLVIGLFMRTFIFRVIRVDGYSMEDTLYTNEYMLVGRLAYRIGEPKHGDVVICRYPGFSDDYVKRVAGLPGDTLEIKNGALYRNGVHIEEPYVVHIMQENLAPVTLKENEYMVYGDNRPGSTDGRELGPLSKSDIKGRVNAIIWPPSGIRRVVGQAE